MIAFLYHDLVTDYLFDSLKLIEPIAIDKNVYNLEKY